jgi:hypothetical protein
MIQKAEPTVDLAALHDCELLDIKYDVSDPQERTLTLVLAPPADDALTQTLRIQARGVVFFQHTAWGHMIGPEILNGWDERISAALEQELERNRAAGVRVPPLRYTLTFHSGSWIELVCERLLYEFVA